MDLGRLFIPGIWILLFVVLMGCDSLQETGLAKQQVSLPEGYYGSVLRFPDGEIFIQAGKLSARKPDALRYYDLSEERFVGIPFVDDPRCQRKTEYQGPTVLPDGRLGLIKSCFGRWPDKPIGRDDARYFLAYDWTTGQVEQIVDEPLSFEAGSITWNPDMTRGVQGIGSLLGTIYWITPDGIVEPMTVTVGSGEQSWALDENLRVMEDYRLGNDRTTEVGIARSASWSPDGRFIAFWASTNLIGQSGMARARGSYALYLLDPDTLELQQILTNVRNVGRLVWSPDSKWLLFGGDIESSRRSLWLVSVDGNTLQFLDEGADLDLFQNFEDWNWLNDQEVIATNCLEPDCNQSEVVTYDVSEIVGIAQE